MPPGTQGLGIGLIFPPAVGNVALRDWLQRERKEISVAGEKGSTDQPNPIASLPAQPPLAFSSLPLASPSPPPGDLTPGGAAGARRRRRSGVTGDAAPANRPLVPMAAATATVAEARLAAGWRSGRSTAAAALGSTSPAPGEAPRAPPRPVLLPRPRPPQRRVRPLPPQRSPPARLHRAPPLPPPRAPPRLAPPRLAPRLFPFSSPVVASRHLPPCSLAPPLAPPQQEQPKSLKNYPKQTRPKLTVQNMHDIKGVKTEMSPNVNSEVPGVGANQGLIQQEAS
nr:vegetative cell wall protein gp1-like [Lolium perenne]